jgi:tetratricopeptide (TPR) repeat protein
MFVLVTDKPTERVPSETSSQTLRQSNIDMGMQIDNSQVNVAASMEIDDETLETDVEEIPRTWMEDPNSMANMKVDNPSTPLGEMKEPPRIWIENPEELSYFPFAKWINVDVQNSPRLTRLFSNLSLETTPFSDDDIEALALPGPAISSLEKAAPNSPFPVEDCVVMIPGSQDIIAASSPENSAVRLFKADAHRDIDAVTKHHSSNSRDFRSFASEICSLFAPQSPLDELWPFPTNHPKRPEKDNSFVTVQVPGQRYKEVEMMYLSQIKRLKYAGQDDTCRAVFELKRSLAIELHNLGRYKESGTLIQSLLSLRRDLESSELEEVFELQLLLVWNWFYLGEFLAAREKLSGLYVTMQKKLTADHPLLLKSMELMTNTLEMLYMNNEAEAMARQYAQICLNYRGPKCETTTYAMYLLARVIGRQDRLSESSQLHRLTIGLRFEIKESPKNSFTDLALSLEKQGRIGEAIKYHRMAVEDAQRSWGPEDSKTLVHNCGLGIALQNKDLRVSEEVLLKTWNLQTEVLGEDVWDTLITMSELGKTLRLSGQIDKSVELQENCFIAWFNIPSPMSQRFSCYELGLCYEEEERYDDALKVYGEYLTRLQAAEGHEYHVESVQEWIRWTNGLICNMLYKAGKALYKAGNFSEGTKHLEECFKTSLGRLDLEDWHISNACNHLGMCYEEQHQYGDAVKLYQELLDAYESSRASSETIERRATRIEGWMAEAQRHLEQEPSQEEDFSKTESSLLSEREESSEEQEEPSAHDKDELGNDQKPQDETSPDEEPLHDQPGLLDEDLLALELYNNMLQTSDDLID